MRLTAAGEKDERALAQRYDVAAFNLCLSAIEDDVDMAEPGWDDSAAWRHCVQKEETGFADAPVLDEEDQALLEGFTPSLEQRMIRNERGEVVDRGFVAYGEPRGEEE